MFDDTQEEQPREIRILWVAPQRLPDADRRLRSSEHRVSVSHVTSTRAALGLLDSPDLVVPHCVFVDPTAAGMHTLLLALRAQPRLSHIPVVYASSRVGQDVLDSAHAVGADDVFWTPDESFLPDLVERLASYRPEERPPLSGNVAFILHPRQERRRMLGRVYRNAGFQVVFGSDLRDLERYTDQSESLDVVVSSRGAIGGGALAVHTARASIRRPELPWILLEEGDCDAILAGVHGNDRIASMGEDGPTENALFLTNELIAAAQAGARRSRRFLLNGLCSFRGTSSLAYRYATLYNISADGLYVRTLTPLPRGERVHLELTAPHGGIVHLSGMVMWARGVAGSPQLAPPGFGVMLKEELCAPDDLAAYVSAYESLAQDHQRVVSRPSATQSFAQNDDAPTLTPGAV